MVDKVGIHRRGGISLEEIIRDAKSVKGARAAGAIGCFIGIVREDGHDRSRVSHLEYEAYEDVAKPQMEKLRGEICRELGLLDLYIHHIVDRVSVGEDTLYVVAVGRHRSEVFKALERAVDRVKAEVAIWKKEITEKGGSWISDASG